MRASRPPAWCRDGRSTSPRMGSIVSSSIPITSHRQERLYFSCARATSTQVFNFISPETMESKFSLTPGENMHWTITDNETGISLTFREGLFNGTLNASIPESMMKVGEDPTMRIAHIMREIGDYMGTGYYSLCTSIVKARCEAIWHLPHPSWWVAIATACINLEHDYALSMTSSELLAEVDDYLDTETPSRWSAAETVNLLGALSMLTDEEAHEVMCAVTAYWEHWYPSGEDIWQWAEEMIWWPSWAREYMPEIDEEDDDD